MSSSSNAIQAFLAEFVVEAMREKAHGALCDLFATLHAALALEFVHAYSTTSVPSAPTSEPHVAPPATKKSKLSQAQACSGKTAKGEACTRKCCPESDTFCSTHLAQSLKPAKQKAEKKTPAAAAAADKKPKKSSASASSQKPVPTHNHALTEEVEANCDLCQTHGNAADPELTTSQFEEISGDLQSRLKSILANLHEVPDDDDDEEDDDEEAESALVKPDADDDQAFGDAALESEGEEEPEEEEEFEDEEESESEVDED